MDDGTRRQEATPRQSTPPNRPEGWRRAVVYRLLAGESPRKISKETGLSVRLLKSWISHVKDRVDATISEALREADHVRGTVSTLAGQLRHLASPGTMEATDAILLVRQADGALLAHNQAAREWLGCPTPDPEPVALDGWTSAAHIDQAWMHQAPDEPTMLCITGTKRINVEVYGRDVVIGGLACRLLGVHPITRRRTKRTHCMVPEWRQCMKERMRTLHHLTANEMHAILGMVSLHRPSDGLTELEGRIRVMALLHAQQHDAADMNQVNLKRSLQRIIDDLDLPPHQPVITLTGTTTEINYVQASAVGLVAHELLHSTVEDGRAQHIELSLTQSESTWWVLSLTDDGGRGVRELPARPGLGLALLQGQVKRLRGVLTVHTVGLDTRMSLRFPVIAREPTPPPSCQSE